MTVQKTQNKMLNNELEKQNILMGQLLGQGVTRTPNSHRGLTPEQHPRVIIEETTVKQTELVGNLKRELDKALKELSAKDSEIKEIKKQSRVTKYRELDVSFGSYLTRYIGRVQDVHERVLPATPPLEEVFA